MSTIDSLQFIAGSSNEAELFDDGFDVDKFLMPNEWSSNNSSNNPAGDLLQSSSPPDDNILTGLLLSDAVIATHLFYAALMKMIFFFYLVFYRIALLTVYCWIQQQLLMGLMTMVYLLTILHLPLQVVYHSINGSIIQATHHHQVMMVRHQVQGVDVAPPYNLNT